MEIIQILIFDFTVFLKVKFIEFFNVCPDKGVHLITEPIEYDVMLLPIGILLSSWLSVEL